VSFFRRESADGAEALHRGDGSGHHRRAERRRRPCASAGIIVGVVTLTGLGLKFSSIVLAYAGNNLVLTALYTPSSCWIVGLAVPVTARTSSAR
jgi:hypothetical protein